MPPLAVFLCALQVLPLLFLIITSFALKLFFSFAASAFFAVRLFPSFAALASLAVKLYVNRV